MSDIFEQPWPLLITAGVILIILLLFRGIFPNRKRWWQFLIPVLIGAAALGLDRLVQTDLEKIEAVIAAVSKAAEEEDCEKIEPLIADDYRDSHHRNKQRLMSRCRSRLSSPLIDKNITTVISTDISSSTATAVFTVRILFDTQSRVYQNYSMRIMLMKIKINLQKTPDEKWLIDRAEIVEINRQPANWQDIR